MHSQFGESSISVVRSSASTSSISFVKTSLSAPLEAYRQTSIGTATPEEADATSAYRYPPDSDTRLRERAAFLETAGTITVQSGSGRP
jgi:hypothetical protein